MKTKISKKGLLLLPVFFLVIIFMISTDDGLVITDQQSSFDIKFEQFKQNEIICTADNKECFDVKTQTILPTQPKLAESDENFVQQITNFINLQGNEEFGIETVAVKYNKANETSSSNSLFPIPIKNLNLATSNGFLVENIQLSFFAVVKQPTLSATLEGTVKFYLDDNLIATKKLYLSSSINSVKSFFVVDTVPPPFSDRPETFDFTFTDEGFTDKSKHNFRAVLTNVNGKLLANDVEKKIDWKGEFIAYDLELIVNESKVTVLNESGKTISIEKTDDKVVACGASGENVSFEYTHCSGTKASSCKQIQRTNIAPDSPIPKMIVKDDNGIIIGEINSVELVSGKTTCKSIEGIKRNNVIDIIVDGKSFVKNTPVSQQNYNLECHQEGGKISVTYQCSSTCTATEHYEPFRLVCTSNFGYESTGEEICTSLSCKLP